MAASTPTALPTEYSASLSAAEYGDAPFAPTHALSTDAVVTAHPAASSSVEPKLPLQGCEPLQSRLQQEQTALTIQRANAEQARRVAACLRVCLESLLDSTTQPCFVFHPDGRLQRWNAAMSQISDIPAARALSLSLPDLFSTEAARCLRSALPGLRRSSAPVLLDGPLRLLSSLPAVRVTLIPLHRIPGCLEAVLALIE